MADKFDKDFDLEPTEYRREDQPEPFWGYNARVTLILFVAAFPISAIAHLIVYGQLPYWLRPLLE
jgi:hypothetical protein